MLESESRFLHFSPFGNDFGPTLPIINSSLQLNPTGKWEELQIDVTSIHIINVAWYKPTALRVMGEEHASKDFATSAIQGLVQQSG